MVTVKLLDRVFHYDKSLQGAEDIMLSITKAVSESEMIIDCMDIDDNTIYLDYDKYIKDNIENIEHISVNLVTKDEFITDILHTTYSYIQGAVPKLQLIIDSFYTGKKESAVIDDLANLTEGITWIYSVGREIIDKYYENKYLSAMLEKGYSDDMQRLGEAFGELQGAIMNMDYILIADILNYEVSEVFEKILADARQLESNTGSNAITRKQH